MITFPFIVGGAFTQSGHPITIPMRCVPRLVAEGLESPDCSVLVPDGRRLPGCIYHSRNNTTVFYQLRINGGHGPDPLARLPLGFRLTVSIFRVGDRINVTLSQA
jgi:hypothetical protein